MARAWLGRGSYESSMMRDLLTLLLLLERKSPYSDARDARWHLE